MMLPNYIEVETSRFCNRHCEWCPNGVLKNRDSQELMAWPHFEKIILALKRYEYSGWFAFHNYNEPLANPRIVKELGFARAHLPIAKLTIFTNGDYLTREILLSLVNAGLTQMRVTVYPRTMKHQSAHKDLWKWVRRRPFLNAHDWQEEIVRQGPALLGSGYPEILLISPQVQNYYDRGGLLPLLSIQSRTSPCSLTSNSLSVDYKGDIKMCCNVVSDHEGHKQYVLGNVETLDPVEAWNSKAFELLRALHKRADWSTTPICKTCRQEID